MGCWWDGIILNHCQSATELFAEIDCPPNSARTQERNKSGQLAKAKANNGGDPMSNNGCQMITI